MSNIFNLDLKDFFNGLITSVICAVLVVIYQTLMAGSFNINWQSVGIIAVTTGISYILKRYGSNEAGEFLK